MELWKPRERLEFILNEGFVLHNMEKLEKFVKGQKTAERNRLRETVDKPQQKVNYIQASIKKREEKRVIILERKTSVWPIGYRLSSDKCTTILSEERK